MDNLPSSPGGQNSSLSSNDLPTPPPSRSHIYNNDDTPTSNSSHAYVNDTLPRRQPNSPGGLSRPSFIFNSPGVLDGGGRGTSSSGGRDTLDIAVRSSSSPQSAYTNFRAGGDSLTKTSNERTEEGRGSGRGQGSKFSTITHLNPQSPSDLRSSSTGDTVIAAARLGGKIF